jgi:hypothetical protein
LVPHRSELCSPALVALAETSESAAVLEAVVRGPGSAR